MSRSTKSLHFPLYTVEKYYDNGEKNNIKVVIVIVLFECEL